MGFTGRKVTRDRSDLNRMEKTQGHDLQNKTGSKRKEDYYDNLHMHVYTYTPGVQQYRSTAPQLRSECTPLLGSQICMHLQGALSCFKLFFFKF